VKKIINSAISIAFFVSVSVFAQTDVKQALFDQLKQNIEKSCLNKDFLACININDETCTNLSHDQLKEISAVLDSNSQAIAEGQFTELLKEIKSLRNSALEDNGIDVEKANSCGKQFLAG